MENGPFIDDLLMRNVDFHGYVGLPEGMYVPMFWKKTHPQFKKDQHQLEDHHLPRISGGQA